MRNPVIRVACLVLGVCGLAQADLNDGLVAYYPFNGNANDESGNGNDGVVVGPFSFLNEKDYFTPNGNSRIEAPHLPSTNSYPITISARIRSSNPEANAVIVSQYANGSWNGYELSGGSSVFKGFFYRNSSNGIDFTTNEFEADKWYSVVFTVAEDGGRLFVNGQLADTGSWSREPVNATSTNPLIIGSREGFYANDVDIDDVRIYNRALSDTEASELYDLEKPKSSLDDGLVAYYPFNGNANDESGNGNNLTTEGQPSYIDGVDGKAILFDGVDDAALTPRLISDNGFTWTGWFELLSLGNQNNFISQSNETIKSSPVLYYRNNESVYFYNYTSRGHSVEYKTDLPTKEWTHISIVCENNGAKKLYINGTLKSENTSSFGFGELNDNFKLGGGRRSDGFSNIQIDELRVYDRPISGDEVAELYKLRTAAPEYQIIEGNFTWQEAKADAETKGGRLAVLDTQAKIDAANAFIQPDDPGVWIGLTDEAQEGLWKWITGEPLTVSNWYEGEPNNLGNEDYATIWSDTLAWNDAQGSNTGAYLLEILDQTPAVQYDHIDPL
ncbi:MAG: hypothetical protein L7U83_10235 [Akkermansiaceae bacterium]|nr:hypothetical protein [Akkermansiaceae bacterium]